MLRCNFTCRSIYAPNKTFVAFSHSAFSAVQFSKNIFLSFPNHFFNGGGKRDRTADPLLARQVLSQLSYTPTMVGLGGLEPPTSRLSGVRSNQLSYRPAFSMYEVRLLLLLALAKSF